MEGVLIAIVLALTSVGVAGAVWHDNQKIRRRLREAAGWSRLEYVDHRLASRAMIRGEVDGFAIRAKRVKRGEDVGVGVTVSGVSSGLKLSPEGARPIAKMLGRKDIEVGDPRLDAQLWVQATSEAEALAALNQRARELAMPFITSSSAGVDEGQVFLFAKGTDRERIHDAIQRSLALARALGPDGQSVPRRLLESLREDPMPGHRLRCLEALLAHPGNSTAGPQAAQIGLQDADARVRVRAAHYLGEADLLAAILCDPNAPSIAQVEAAEALAQVAPDTFRASEDVVLSLLVASRDQVLLPAIRALAAAGGAGAVARLHALASGPASTAVRKASRAAAAAIQERVGAPGQGALSVVGAGSAQPGALSEHGRG